MSSEPQPDRPDRPPWQRLLERCRRSQLGGLAKDTGFVAIWQASIVGAGLAQIALITHAFGISEYGRFAVVVAFVELIGGLFNLRVGYAATTFGARWLVRDTRVAAGVFQLSLVIDMATTAVAVLLLAVLAYAVGPHVGGSDSTEVILIYALVLIGPALSRASFVVLRLLDRFALIATYQWALELGRLALIVLAIELVGSLLGVIIAIVVAKLVAGMVNAGVAAHAFRRTHDVALSRPHLRSLERLERRAMVKTMFHALVITYGQVVRAQVPTVLLGALAGTTQTGIYKIGTAVAVTVGKVIAPASNALLPRLSRLWAADRLVELRQLVLRASAISAAAMSVAFAALLVFQGPILRLLGGGEAGEAASTVLVLAAATQALYGLVFWHTTLLFAAHRTGSMSIVSVAAAVVHLLAMLILVPDLGATGAAVALLISQVVLNVALTTLALSVLRSATPETPERSSAAPAALG